MSEWINQISQHPMVPGISHRMVYCTPQLAEKLLTLNTNNRKLREGVVSKYVSEISSEQWMPTASGVGISDRGVLLDGQHRLQAILNSGKSAPIMIVWGLPAKSQEKIDRQQKRTLVDAFNLSGFQCTRRAVSIASFLTKKNLGDWFGSVSDGQIRETIDCHHDSIEWVQEKNSGNFKGLCTAGIMAAETLAYEIDPAKCALFVDKLLDPSMLTADDPRFRLNNWARNGIKRGRGGMGAPEDFRMAAGAINAFFQGRKTSALRQNDEVTG